MTKEELLKIPFYIEDISGSENTVIIYNDNVAHNLEYSTDGVTWITDNLVHNNIQHSYKCPPYGKIYFRGVNSYWSYDNIF